MLAAHLFPVNAITNTSSDPASALGNDIANVRWQKSSFSAYNGNCVEVGSLGNGIIGIRDTKDLGTGPILAFTKQEWAAFLSGIKVGEFDHLP